jgi:D-glycero-D-manno-heptose 1,7-bisphosphate phosphatase
VTCVAVGSSVSTPNISEDDCPGGQPPLLGSPCSRNFGERVKHGLHLVLADRDGVLNEELPNRVQRPEELVLLPGVAEAVRRLNEGGIPIAVVTNQSIVGRGLITESDLDAIHDRLQSELNRAAGGKLDLILYAPDHPDNSGPNRKPAPGMLIKAMARFGVAPEDTMMIGDDLPDIQAAVAAGCQRMLVRTGKGAALERSGLPASVRPIELCDSFADAIERLLRRL